tara:strand:- start:518 stop:733 length:216 start_codon:yes stop_codon:yes gene_type:complete
MTTNAIQMIKGNLVLAPEGEYEDIVAFQLVTFAYNAYGKAMESILDTKIDKSGKQTVIEGDGFIKTGYAIN